MGMAASQARLLCITARIHDVEYQAQSIQNAKTQLATLSDEAYQEYLRELDDTTLTISVFDNDNNKSRIIANFNNLCSRNRVKSSDNKEYAIRDKDGKLIVEHEIASAYANFKNINGITKDAYAFAMYMISGCDYNAYTTVDRKSNGEDAIHYAEEAAFGIATEDDKNKDLAEKHQRILNIIQQAYDKKPNKEPGDSFDNNDIYDPNGFVSNYGDRKLQEEYREALASYKDALYTGYSGYIYKEANAANLGSDYSNFDPEKDFDSGLLNYFASIYKQIQACGGCKSISDFDGFNGEAANNEEWLSAMIQCGEFTIEIAEKNKTTGLVDMHATSPSSDISLSYSTTTDIDSKAMRRAEAKYEHTLKKIDAQDKKYDLTLSKLETERSALTTQYDSLKKVIDENIERTFGIFS